MMKQMLAAAACLFAAPAWAQWSVNIHIGAPPYYGYAPAEVVYVERYVPVYDVPRIFVVARHARVRPALVADVYRRGGWAPVCSRFGVPRELVYGYGPAAFAPPPVAVYEEHGRRHREKNYWRGPKGRRAHDEH